MLKFIQKKLKEEKGLTLIELLAVIVILGIIAAIAIPAIGNIIENSRHGAVKADFQNAIAAANLYVTENGTLPEGTATEQLTAIGPYLDDPGSITGVEFTRGATTAAEDGGPSFSASADGSIAVTGTATANDNDYAITTAVTNSFLGDMNNGDFGDEFLVTP